MSFMSKLKEKKKKDRTAAEIQQEYGQLCAQIGENTFRMKETERVTNTLMARVRELGQEMAAAQAKVDAAKAKAMAEAQPVEEAK